MAKADITVTVEAWVHRAIAAVVQKVADDHGIRVLSMRAEWVGDSEIDRGPAQVIRVDLETSRRVLPED